jgi:hypothetical protein
MLEPAKHSNLSAAQDEIGILALNVPKKKNEKQENACSSSIQNLVEGAEILFNVFGSRDVGKRRYSVQQFSLDKH